MVHSELRFERKPPTNTDQLLESPALREVWQQLEQRASSDRERNILQSIIAQPRFQRILAEVRSLAQTDLANQLQTDLWSSYGALQAGCPTSIHDLRQRMRFVDNLSNQDVPLPVSTELSLEEKRLAAEKSSAANTRDYLMQVMTAVKNLADFLEERPHSDASTPLMQLFKQQEQRLARLLVAIEQDGQKQLKQAA